MDIKQENHYSIRIPAPVMTQPVSFGLNTIIFLIISSNMPTDKANSVIQVLPYLWLTLLIASTIHLILHLIKKYRPEIIVKSTGIVYLGLIKRKEWDIDWKDVRSISLINYNYKYLLSIKSRHGDKRRFEMFSLKGGLPVREQFLDDFSSRNQTIRFRRKFI